ncbi:Uncharacterised protein [uncultured archaeon]|nr:Uncharacterised protein [uncultured archaeon]
MSTITDGKYTEPRCPICMSDYRDVIEEAIMSMSKSQKQICKEYNLKEDSLSRHKIRHMMGNVKDKLQGMIQTALLGNMQPQSIQELLRLLEYVQNMNSENFLAGKSEWDKVKESKLEKFRKTIMNPKIPVEDKETIVRIAELCFVKENADVGDLLTALMKD